MKKNTILSSSYNFHSIKNLYKGSSETDLHLEIYEYGTDAVEIKLRNRNYTKQCRAFRMQFIYFSLYLIVYSILLYYKTFYLLLNVGLAVWSMFLVWRINQLVESENIIFCHDFGIHLQVQTVWGKHNRFVTASNIHDIVINEVIDGLDFRYLLILRTKGKLFNKKPIICILKVFKPCYECLSLIYKHLNKVTVRTKN